MSGRNTITIEHMIHRDGSQLDTIAGELLQEAIKAADRAYAPYSSFKVGTALRLADGTIVTGNNQENASFPAGLCAERIAIATAMSRSPEAKITDLLVIAPQVTGATPVSPCGICRQVMHEQELRQQAPMRLFLAMADGPIHEFASAGLLLPFSFDASFL